MMMIKIGETKVEHRIIIVIVRCFDLDILSIWYILANLSIPVSVVQDWSKQQIENAN